MKSLLALWSLGKFRAKPFGFPFHYSKALFLCFALVIFYVLFHVIYIMRFKVQVNVITVNKVRYHFHSVANNVLYPQKEF